MRPKNVSGAAPLEREPLAEHRSFKTYQDLGGLFVNGVVAKSLGWSRVETAETFVVEMFVVFAGESSFAAPADRIEVLTR